MAAARTTSRRKARTPLKGRALVAIGLAVFFVVATSVVWRRSMGVKTERQMKTMRDELRALTAEEKSLENALRKATSRRSVVQEAERRLGMRMPSEMQMRFLGAKAISVDVAPPDSGMVP